MKTLIVSLLTLLLVVGAVERAEAGDAIGLYDLKVEHLRNPIQLDIKKPRLSWKIRSENPETRAIEQRSYQILVASSAELLTDDKADLWNSQRVESSQSVLVPYEGQQLNSRQSCYWKVRVTDNRGNDSSWSDVAKWEMALLEPTDWKGSQWIGLPAAKRDHELAHRTHEKLKEDLQSHISPLLRKEIVLSKPVRKARAYVSGLGYSELYINGSKIGDHVLDPGQTNYEKHSLYVVHDVTEALRQGDNALGVWLGNGFFGQNLGFVKKFGYGQPTARAKLFVEYTDGTAEQFGTDTSWKATASPIVFDNVYWGETYDARLEIPRWSQPGLDDSKWQDAIELPSPCADSKLRPQLLPPIKAMERLKPVAVTEVAPDTWLLDFGKNISGWVEIKVNQNKGDVIKVFPAEVLTKKPPKNVARADQVTYGGAPGSPHELVYVCKGDGEETWAPRFTYGGFQYVEISGLTKAPAESDIEAIFVRSAIERTGSFSCSNDMLNRQYEASLLSLEGNWHSLPEDCPHREKCGWLGDAYATADLSFYNYDIFRFYSKFNRDIQDSLTKGFHDGSGGFKVGERVSKLPNDLGGVPTFVAPGKRSARVASIDWGVAYLILPWQMYLHTADVESFKPHYDHIKDFISYFRTYKNQQGVIQNGLGDWCPPRWDRRQAPEFMECHPHVSGTAYYYLALTIASQMADVLGDEALREEYLEEADEIKQAFGKVYLKSLKDSDLKHFGSQTATVMALKLAMVDADEIEDRVAALVHDINQLHDGHHACGIHGLRHLYTVLADQGHEALAFKMLTDTTFPGPGYVMDCGLSTWPERRFEWKKVRYSNSFNHPMNGGFAAFMHESVGGIGPDPAAPGYKQVRLKPHLTDQLEWVKARTETPYGPIRSQWKSDSESFEWEVDVPANTTATLLIPKRQGKTLLEDDQEFTGKMNSVTEGNRQWWQLEIGSGTYRFRVK